MTRVAAGARQAGVSEPVTRLVLVRHGEARGSVDGVISGERGCGGLTSLGRDQAHALARRLTTTGELAGAVALVSSHLRRAVETAAIVAPALGHPVLIRRDELGELDPGEGDGLTWAAGEQRFGRFDLAAEPHRRIAPGGESWAGFGARARRALGAVARDHVGSTVVVCCHSGVISQSVVLGFGLDPLTPPGRPPLEPVPHASLTEWRVHVVGGAQQRWTLVHLGDAGHLDAPLRAGFS